MSTLFYHHSRQCCELDGAVSLPRHKMNAKTGRCLSISSPKDRVVLNPILKTEFPAISQHFKRIGLNVSEDILWQDYNKPLVLAPSSQLSTYCYSPSTLAIDDDTKRLKATSRYLLKSKILKKATRFDVPTPKTTYYQQTSMALSERDLFAYPVYLKPDNASDGMGIIRCESKEKLTDTLASYPYTPFLVQEEICADHFLSLHFHAQKNKATHILTAKQILEANATIGHEHPYPHVISKDVIDKFTTLAQQLVTEGLKEYFGFDLAAVNVNEQFHYILMECNPRYTFATYPAIIAKKLNIEHWQTRNYGTPCRQLSQLQLRPFEFNRKTNSGIILIDWGMILLGELTIMLIGNKQQQQQLDRSLTQHLSKL